MSGLVLDTGALIALERGKPYIRTLLAKTVDSGLPVIVPSGVLAQAWRGGPRQYLISRFLLTDDRIHIAALDRVEALLVGVKIGECRHPDVVDVHVALLAIRRDAMIATSDRDDILAVEPNLRDSIIDV